MITDNTAERRWELFVDGTLAVFAEYQDAKRRTFTHTETQPGFEGQGLATELVRAALDDARERGLDVLPVCPFVRGYLERHPDYVDLVPASARARFGLGGASSG